MTIGGGGPGGLGGTATLGGAVGVVWSGSTGQMGTYYLSQGNNDVGAPGGSSPFSGAGQGGSPANASSGSGGGGGSIGGCCAAVQAGSGGGSGGYVDAIISSPALTYSFSVGIGGAGGSPAAALASDSAPGQAGGSGIIIVEENY